MGEVDIDRGGEGGVIFNCPKEKRGIKHVRLPSKVIINKIL
jgi:hypothetical protein